MQNDAATVWPFPVLKQVHALPGAQRQLSIVDRNRHLCLGECGTDVGSHVIRSFRGVAIEARIFGNESSEEIRKISHYIRVGILLNYQRCRGVLAENGQEAGLGLVSVKPGRYLTRKRVQAFALGRNVDLVSELLHSTVT